MAAIEKNSSIEKHPKAKGETAYLHWSPFERLVFEWRHSSLPIFFSFVYFFLFSF